MAERGYIVTVSDDKIVTKIYLTLESALITIIIFHSTHDPRIG